MNVEQYLTEINESLEAGDKQEAIKLIKEAQRHWSDFAEFHSLGHLID